MNTFLNILRFASPLCWLGVAGVGVGIFVYLATASDLVDGATPRTAIDKAVPYLFLLLVPYGLWQAYREFQQAQNEAQLAKELVQKEELRKKRIAAAKVRLDAQPLELTTEQKASISSLLAALRQYGIVGEGEIDDAKFHDLCLEKRVETATLYELSVVLGAYSERHGDLTNCLIVYDQVEIHENDITAMVEGFARLAGRSGAVDNLTFEIMTHDAKPLIGEVQFMLDGTAQNIRFDYYNKYASSSLMERLAELFQSTGFHFCFGYFDSNYVVSRLTQQQRVSLNDFLSADEESFTALR